MGPTTVFTDGACSGNPGPGGWAWAVPEAVVAIEGTLVSVTDAAYVASCWRDEWVGGWRRRGWRNTAGKPVANRELWEPLITASEMGRFGVPRWVKGHSGDPMNDLVDRLAVAACQRGQGASGSEPRSD